MKKVLSILLAVIVLSACTQSHPVSSSIIDNSKLDFEKSLNAIDFHTDENHTIWSYGWLNDNNIMIITKENGNNLYNRKIYHYNLDTNESLLLYEGELISSYYDIYFLTEGENLGLQIGSHNLLIFDKNQLQPIDNMDINQYDGYVMVSPNLNKIVYADEKGLWLCNLDGTQKELIAASPSFIYPTWSKDSRYILFFQLNDDGNNTAKLYDTQYKTLNEFEAGKSMSGKWFQNSLGFLFLDSGVTSSDSENISASLHCYTVNGDHFYTKNESFIFKVADTTNDDFVMVYNSDEKIGFSSRKNMKSINTTTSLETDLISNMPFIDIRNVQFSPSLQKLAYIGKEADHEAKIYWADYQ